MPSKLSNLSDAELVLSMKEGNKAAFDVIYDRYWKKLYNETFKRLNNAENVEEIVQDVFMDLWSNHHKRVIQHLYAYLVTAARYTVYAAYKKKETTPHFVEPLDHMSISTLEADTLLNVKEIKQCVNVWIVTQPEKRAEIFRLRYLEEYTTREIGEMLGISQKTVQNQLITSFASLRSYLSKIMMLFMLF